MNAKTTAILLAFLVGTLAPFSLFPIIGLLLVFPFVIFLSICTAATLARSTQGIAFQIAPFFLLAISWVATPFLIVHLLFVALDRYTKLAYVKLLVPTPYQTYEVVNAKAALIDGLRHGLIISIPFIALCAALTLLPVLWVKNDKRKYVIAALMQIFVFAIAVVTFYFFFDHGLDPNRG